MKRRFSFAVALLAAATLATPALAASQSIGQESLPIDVYARYVDGSTTGTVYSVDISWGNMQFTYAKDGNRTWNPSDHTYNDETTTQWQADGNTIQVTNHSNTDVTATFAFSPFSNLPDLQGSFSVPSQLLDAGKENDYAGADSVTSQLTLSGAYTAEGDFAKVGTVTVSIQ